jgi:hypothetical protein
VRVAPAEPAELHDVLVESARERVRLWVADQHAAVA